MTLRDWIENAPERWRRKIYPKLGRIMLKLATYEARRDWSGDAPIGILVDTCILELAVTHETVWIQRDTFGAATRVPVYDAGNRSERHLQVSYLTVIRYLAQHNYLKLWRSRSLDAEQQFHPRGMVHGYGLFDRSLFADMRLPNIDGHIPLTIGSKRWGFRPIEEQLKDEFIGDPDDPIFKELWRLMEPTVGARGNRDVWHLASAERYGLAYFLTTDEKFRRSVDQLSHKEPLKSFKAKVVTPAQLGGLLKLRPVAPIVLSYEDTNVFVSTETVMPNQSRRKRPRG